MRAQRDPPSDLSKLILEMKAKRRETEVPDTNEDFVRWLMNLLDEQYVRFRSLQNKITGYRDVTEDQVWQSMLDDLEWDIPDEVVK